MKDRVVELEKDVHSLRVQVELHSAELDSFKEIMKDMRDNVRNMTTVLQDIKIQVEKRSAVFRFGAWLMGAAIGISGVIAAIISIIKG